MNFISASYNMYHNGIDITIFDGYILRIDCNKAETGLKTTPQTDHVLNALAIDNPLEYARSKKTGKTFSPPFQQKTGGLTPAPA